MAAGRDRAEQMSFQSTSLILAGVISIADYVTEHFFPERIKNSKKLVSFSAGVAIAYIILSLLPEISSYALIDGKKIFMYVLIGFIVLNLIEQYIYKHLYKSRMKPAYHKNFHVTYFFVYKVLIGVVLVNFATRGLTSTLLFFIPFFLYIMVETLPQEFRFTNALSRIFYSTAVLLGSIIGLYFFEFADSVFGEMVSFISGTLLYIVIKESLPSDQSERPLYFALGAFAYSLIIFFSWGLL